MKLFHRNLWVLSFSSLFLLNFSLPRKPIMNPFLLVLTFKFTYSLLNLLFIYYLHILVILQLAVMYFNTEWSKIFPVPNIQINFWFLFYAKNNLKLVFFSNVLFSNMSIWNKVVFFFFSPLTVFLIHLFYSKNPSILVSNLYCHLEQHVLLHSICRLSNFLLVSFLIIRACYLYNV